ncbi:Camk2g [Symbiodinium pilosum]|uniref:Camk2g protein n=1 Tax=Symbiodinium pilosum TaxID=2952 RepID=A0A812PG36_SYMPI|nr:Camk2g [Symbiodinium pilosum]
MPYMNGRDLFSLIGRCEGSTGCSSNSGCKGYHLCWSKVKGLSMAYVLALFLDVVKGVDAIHERGMLHTDLKPENVMLNCEDKKCFAAVIDFGLVCNMSDPDDCWISGSPGYMAPEVYLQDEEAISRPSRDVWALGTILYLLLYKQPPPYQNDRSGEHVIGYNPLNDTTIPPPENQTRTDKLVVQMLLKYELRPSVPDIIKELQDIIAVDFAAGGKAKLPPADIELAQSMAALSPTERGATQPTPACLFEQWGRDIGDLPFRREFCADKPQKAVGLFHCGPCPSFVCNPCCKCRVLRHTKVVKEYFRMQVCQ